MLWRLIDTPSGPWKTMTIGVVLLPQNPARAVQALVDKVLGGWLRSGLALGWEAAYRLIWPSPAAPDPCCGHLREQMEGQAVIIILSDHSGLVLSRSSGEPELDRYLDMVELAPGFCYGEDSVGTNGIGTALEIGGPVAVLGHEHYVENLERLSCVAVPIKHPVTGRTVGVLNLTCWTRDAGPLLLSLAKNAVAQIRQS